MANVLGTLLVELGVNIGAYLDGMSKATYTAKKTGKDIQHSFEEIGSALSGVLGQFGVLGEVVEKALGSAGNYAASAASNFGALGPALGVAAAGAGAFVGVAAAAGVGALAIAKDATEGASKLYEMSEATGVSVETLSRFGYIARQNGVDSEVMVKGLERLSRSAFTAATAPAGAVNAYTRLGISVRDSQGNIKDAEALFGEVADKLSNLSSATERVALAQQLFGRGGAALIPIFAEGKEGIAKMSAEADLFGVTIGGQTAQAAHQFQQSLDKITEAGAGLENQLMVQLLPSMQTVATQFVDALKDPDSGLRSTIHFVGVLGEVILSLGELIGQVFHQAYNVIWGTIATLQEASTTLRDEAKAALHLDWDGFVEAGQAGGSRLKKVWAGTWDDMKKDGGDFLKTIDKIWSDAAAPTGPKKDAPKTGRADTSDNEIGKRMAALLAQINLLKQGAVQELAAASAIGENSAAILINKAAAEAATKVQELLGKAVDKSGQPIKAEQDLINKNAEAIKSWYEVKVAAASLASFGTKVNDETTKLNEQNIALAQLTAAYLKGGAAIENAKVDQALAADNAGLAKQSDIYKILVKDLGATNPMVVEYKADLDKATASVQAHGAAIRANDIAKLAEQIAAQTNALRGETAAFAILTAAALKNSQAQRTAAAEAARAKAEADSNGLLSQKELQQVYDNALKQQDQAYEKSVAAVALQHDLNIEYQDTITKLKAAKALLVQNGADTLSIDAAILAAQENANAQWDTAALKVGTFQQRVVSVLDTLKTEGNHFGETVFQSFATAINGVEDQLAKLVVTGKANFVQIGQAMEESIVKAGIQKLTSTVSGGLLGAMGLGGTSKPDGTASNPLNVVFANGALDGLGLSASNGLFGPGFGAGGAGNGVMGAVSGIAQGVGGVLGKVGGFLGSIFGGFLAGGGDVTPGKAYIVGEKRPEMFVPNSAGRIVPSLSGGKMNTTTVHLHISGVTDADSFKKSQAQISSIMGNAIARSQQRLGR